ncbi:uncharacterized protein LOC125766869 isoform X2 [Anopheles funestus]|uniref:uncharacterized protein LOC125766869 isoform X2 n=1 Tax=Anopheles funestus TaxID=62324 RepID=UPI0020C6F62E|nr:uncharacterized protein LOC125766869 isoform X2 [Anopheles funestus]
MEPSSVIPSSEEDRCGECNGVPYDEMAQCDSCKQWFHFDCVDVSVDTVAEDWQCRACHPPPQQAKPGTEDMSVITQEINALRLELANQRKQYREERAAMEAEISRLSCGQQNYSRSQDRNAFEARNLGAHSTRRFSTFENMHELSRSQVAARKVVSGKLPTFSGNPDEWSNFKSRFDTTTRMCGFTDDENVLRLQECLSGRALKMVQRRLNQAENVQQVMADLEKMYGRPEVLVEGILQQIRQAALPKVEKMQSMIDFGVAIEELCATIRTQGMHEQNYNTSLLAELVERLPPYVRLMWGIHRETSLQKVTLENFGAWMRTITNAAISVTPPPSQEVTKTSARVHTHTETKKKESSCVMCQKNDCPTGADCKKFISSSINERWGYVRKHRLCRTCVLRHSGRCNVSSPCGVNGCSAYHNSALHGERPSNPNSTTVLSHSSIFQGTLLRYVPVALHGNGKVVRTFALLDEGSSVTLMDHALLKELQLEGKPEPICLSWTGDQKRDEHQSQSVAIGISGIDAMSKTYVMPKVHTVAELALPAQTLSVPHLAAKYAHLRETKTRSYHHVTPKVLIGINNFHLTRPLKTIEGAIGEPFATKTRLGWVICGPHEPSAISTVKPKGVHLCTCSEVDMKLDETLRKYFAADNNSIYGDRAKIPSKEEERSLKLLESTTRFVGDRFETGLLWRADEVTLPDNRRMALNRLECLEKRLRRDDGLTEVINNKLKEYQIKGYVRKISDEELIATRNNRRKWYLPIFPVWNPNKPGKVRLVWDAAAAVRGVSLNTNLLTGPDLLTPLPSVLFRFREYRYAFAADIREMYHQVMIRTEDQHSQRFLWRWGDNNREPEEFVMTRMTFGATCSHSSAQYVKNLNADRFIAKLPRAVRCIKEQHYVDDLLASTECEEDAVKLANEVRDIHAQGGFQLHNWLSNSNQIANNLSGNVAGQREFNSDTVCAQKILGMWWNIQSDTFSFKLIPKQDHDILEGHRIPTKRQILRVLMSIYDPLGLLAGFLLYLKVILQEVWRANIGWDEKIPHELFLKWKQWLDGLTLVQKISIPRCYRQHIKLQGIETQLHVFVDAGRDGYAAVAYLRFQCGEHTEVSLVGGKAKVSPLKYMSIPRMELQAAVIGSRLAQTIQQSHDQRIDQRFLWTDSRDVMCWLHSDHRKYSIFVGHRVGEILENTTVSEWRWVPTKLNVADESTKWSNLQQHVNSSRWFTGPAFLKESITDWPPVEFLAKETEEEARKTVTLHQALEPIFSFERFSKWRRLLRAIGYVWRFINNAKNPSTRCGAALTAKELQQAERSILREVQRQAYPQEYCSLDKQSANEMKPISQIKRSSPLYKRSPFMDQDGILRVTGRIDACVLVDPTAKRPIILPKCSVVTDLIVDDFHQRFRHANHDTVINEVRTKYDIPALRSVCRRVRKACTFCRIRETIPRTPVMSQLPPARLAAYLKPFSFTGIDYFGPISVSMGRGRSEKRWGVLFTCMTIRAIHIEVASSLSTDACILALRNFIARRGTPNEILSDQGTNFVGASRELIEAAKNIDSQRLVEEIDCPNTTWTFNPPSAPHFGGSWERMIRTERHPV